MSFPLILPIYFTVILFPYMFFFLFLYILTVHPLMFHRVFPSYTTHSFHRDSLSLHIFFSFSLYFNSSPLIVLPCLSFLYYPFVSSRLSLSYYPFVSPCLSLHFNVHPLLCYCIFPSYTTPSFHRVFPYILKVHPLLFHRVFPSYTTLSFHCVFPYILIVHPLKFYRVYPRSLHRFYFPTYFFFLFPYILTVHP